MLGIKIFHYQGGINFASRNYFKDDLYDMVGIDPQKQFIYKRKLSKLGRMIKCVSMNISKNRIRAKENYHGDRKEGNDYAMNKEKSTY